MRGPVRTRFHRVGDNRRLLRRDASNGANRTQAYGFFVNGYRKGNTRRIASTLLVVIEAVYLSSIWLKYERHVVRAPLVAGAIIVPIVLFGMKRWMDAYRSEFGSIGDIRT